MNDFVIWPLFVPSIIYKGGQLTKPIIVVKMSELLYIIQVKGEKFIFLALFDMLLLIGLALFLQPG